MTRLLLKLGALLSFLGGPMRLADVLKPQLGQDKGFLVAFAPIAILLFCLLNVFEETPTRATRVFARIAQACALLVLAMNASATFELATGRITNSPSIIAFGVVVGTVCAVAVLRLMQSRLAPPPAAGEPPPLP